MSGLGRRSHGVALERTHHGLDELGADEGFGVLVDPILGKQDHERAAQRGIVHLLP